MYKYNLQVVPPSTTVNLLGVYVPADSDDTSVALATRVISSIVPGTGLLPASRERSPAAAEGAPAAATRQA